MVLRLGWLVWPNFADWRRDSSFRHGSSCRNSLIGIEIHRRRLLGGITFRIVSLVDFRLLALRFVVVDEERRHRGFIFINGTMATFQYRLLHIRITSAVC